MAAENRFRSDLFYRLNVFPITIPPLRERPEDIPVLMRFFANKFAGRMKKQIETIPAEAVAALQQYHWPGNIRELENMIERAVILTVGAELSIIQIQSGNILDRGDSMSIWLDANTRKQRRVEISTFLEKSPVKAVIEFSDLPAGPTYMARTIVDYPKDALQLITENFDYERER